VIDDIMIDPDPGGEIGTKIAPDAGAP